MNLKMLDAPARKTEPLGVPALVTLEEQATDLDYKGIEKGSRVQDDFAALFWK